MAGLGFQVLKEDHGARRGRLFTRHGAVDTPAFMPVGTAGSVKGLTPDEIRETGAEMILGNTYHLYLRPGLRVLEEAGGLARWTGWNGPTLTDSGGYQIFSLPGLRRVTEEGVEFRSHLDGSRHLFTPESVMEAERIIGADVVMPLDQFPGLPASREEVALAVARTTRWAERSKRAFRGEGQIMFGIVQGGVDPELRECSATELLALDFSGYAIGGLSVGESKEDMYGVLDLLSGILPRERPRYLMGVGSAADLVEAVARGVDLFDSVFPTRLGRHGWILTGKGPVPIRRAQYRADFSPPDPYCDCSVCRSFNRSYLHHLFRAGEILGMRLASYHNLYFTERLLEEVRQRIEEETFSEFRERWAEGVKISEGDVNS